ncbi:MAG: fasciclin domain-containing protein [Anaerolineae bacterium]|nr:fasciclin domain-containing protein [Anaerolineae bacterium]
MIRINWKLAVPTIQVAPATAQAVAQSIVDLVLANDRFATLVTAVTKAGLVDTLAGPGPYTLLLPTDEAFAKLPAGTIEALLNDIPALTDILLYHVIPGQVPAATMVTLESADTALGVPVTITVEGDKVMINDATVVTTDVEASNGLIHVIDTVLLPPES